MAQKYSNNEIRNLGEDWGRDTRDEKYRPFSNGAVQRFIKKQFQEQINSLEDKIGWLRFEGGRIVMYNQQDGTPIGSILLSGTIYAIDLQTDTASNFYVLTTDVSKTINITPSSKSGTLGGTLVDFVEDYDWILSLDSGTGEWVEKLRGSCLNGNSVSTDIRRYVTTGTQRLRFTFTGKESMQSKSLVFTCTVTNLTLTCNYSWQRPFIEGQTYMIDKIYFGGNLTKTLNIMVDNDLNQVYTKEFNSGQNYQTADYQYNMTDKFPSGGTGIHTVEIWMEGEGIETPHYIYNMMCVSQADANQVQLVCINNVADTVYNYETQTLFKYATYNCNSVTFNLSSNDNGVSYPIVTNNTLSVNSGQKINYDMSVEIDTDSRVDLFIDVTATVSGCTQQCEIPVDNNNAFAAVENPTFYLNTANRSNGNADRNYFVNFSTSPNILAERFLAQWDGFAWSKDGWVTDDQGVKCLAVRAGAEVKVTDFRPLALTSTMSETIEFKYKCSNIANYDLPIMSMMDTDTFIESATTGVILFPTKIVVMSNGQKLITPQSVNLDEEVVTHITIVFQRNAMNSGRNLCRIYVNSVQNAVFEYGGNNHFGNGMLRIGQASSDVYLYMFRQYLNRVLEESDVLSNFMNTLGGSSVYNRNEVRYNNQIVDGGEINYDLCKQRGYNTMVIQTANDFAIPSIEQTSSVNSTLSLEFAEHPTWNFTITNAPMDGQGTTSKKYYRWNLRWKLKDAAEWTYADGSTSTKSGYFDGGQHPKVNKITAKKNVASSGQGHKMGATNFYDELYQKVGLKSTLPSVETRVAVYEYPVMGFQKMSDGSYTFIGLYTIGPDKGDSKTFGYNSDTYPSYLSLEGPNHNPLATRFLHPWVSGTTIYNPDEETLEFGGQEGWDVDSCPYETDKQSDQANIQALLEAEWKPAYDIVYYCSPYIRSLSEVGYTLAQLNNNKIVFRNSMNILGNRRNEVLQLYDPSDYKIIYYDNSSQEYVKLNHNIVSYLNSYLTTQSPNTNQIIAARKAKFRAEAGNYWDVNACLFHSCFCELVGGTDNHAKNSYPFKLKTLAQGGRWTWRQDDLDTVMATDNNGQSTKSYGIEVGDITQDGTDIFQGASSALWTLFDDVFAEEKKTMMTNMFTQIAAIASEKDISAPYLHDTVYNVFKHYFWDNSAEYFPSLSYNKDATWTYITPWYINPAQSYNNVYPLTQALGTQESAENLWVKRRIIYLMSLYQIGGFTGSQNDGYGSIEFTPAQTFTFHVTPAVDMYPSGNKGGGENIKGTRTRVGETCDILADSDGSTTFYLKATDLLTDIGDLSQLVLTTRGGDASVGASLAVNAKKLQRLKVGDANANNVRFNASQLTVNCPCLEVIDARNATTIQNGISLLNCPRLKKVYLAGTNATSVILPLGSMVDEVSYPNGIQTLFLHSLPMLTSSGITLTNQAVQNISGLYFYNCPKLSPFELLRRIYNEGGNLKFITMIWDGQWEGTQADLNMILSFTTPYSMVTGEGFGSIEYDEENNLIANSNLKPNLQGKIRIHGCAFRSTIQKIRNYWGNSLDIEVDDYYLDFEDPNWNQLVADLYGDGVGITQTQALSVSAQTLTNIQNIFNELVTRKNVDVVDLRPFKRLYYTDRVKADFHWTDVDKAPTKWYFDSNVSTVPTVGFYEWAYNEDGTRYKQQLDTGDDFIWRARWDSPDTEYTKRFSIHYIIDEYETTIRCTNQTNQIADSHYTWGMYYIRFNSLRINVVPYEGHTNTYNFHGYFLRYTNIGDLIIDSPEYIRMDGGWGASSGNIKGDVFVPDDLVEIYKHDSDLEIASHIAFQNIASKIKPLSTYRHRIIFN